MSASSNGAGGIASFFPYSKTTTAPTSSTSETSRMMCSGEEPMRPTLDNSVLSNSSLATPWWSPRPFPLPSFVVPNYASQVSLPTPLPVVGPYDIIELKVTSLHAIRGQREASRIIAVAAGENLHNVYRVIMTSLSHREDRARLVFHAWILPDASVYGNGSRVRDSTNNSSATPPTGNDREVYFNQLPIYIGYQLELVFGKCVYHVVVQDLFLGLTDEQDLIWTPRVCEGSYGEAVPFDLCYSPHLFRSRLPSRCKKEYSPSDVDFTKSELSGHTGELQDASPSSSTASGERVASAFYRECESPHDSPRSPGEQRLSQFRPVHSTNHYLTNDELDEINRNLSRMRFIRQYSQIKPLLRKNRPEDYIPDEEKRRQCFRMTVRAFFFALWSRYGLDVSPPVQFVPPTHPVDLHAGVLGSVPQTAGPAPAGIRLSGIESQNTAPVYLNYSHPAEQQDAFPVATKTSPSSGSPVTAEDEQKNNDIKTLSQCEGNDEISQDHAESAQQQAMHTPEISLSHQTLPLVTGSSGANVKSDNCTSSSVIAGPCDSSAHFSTSAHDYFYPGYHNSLTLLSDAATHTPDAAMSNAYDIPHPVGLLATPITTRPMYPRCRVSKRYTAPPPDHTSLLSTSDATVSSNPEDGIKPIKKATEHRKV